MRIDFHSKHPPMDARIKSGHDGASGRDGIVAPAASRLPSLPGLTRQSNQLATPDEV